MGSTLVASSKILVAMATKMVLTWSVARRLGIGSSIIDVTVGKSPNIIKFFGDLADQRGGVVVREGC